jgi:hypothetical protein
VPVVGSRPHGSDSVVSPPHSPPGGDLNGLAGQICGGDAYTSDTTDRQWVRLPHPSPGEGCTVNHVMTGNRC